MRQRVRLTLFVALPAFALDQATKLAAAAVHPSTYVQNPTWRSPLWSLAVVALVMAVLLVPFRPLAPAVGLWLGGAAGNLLDIHVWPGGVPDFIRVAAVGGTFNLADVFVAAGAAGVGAALLLWSALGVVHAGRRGGPGLGGQIEP